MKYIALLLALLSLQLSAQTKKLKEDFYSYEYPADWDTLRNNGAVAVLAPLDGATDDFRENLNIIYQNVTEVGQLSSDEYLKLNTSQLEAYGIKIDAITKQTVGPKKLEGNAIAYVTDKFMQDGSELSIWQVLLKHNDKFIVITYSARPNAAAKYFELVKKIVATVQFK